MGIGIGEKVIQVIDRSFPEIMRIKPGISRFELLCLMRHLKFFGVDLFELDRSFIRYVTKLPADLEFIFRLRSADDLCMVQSNSISHVLVEAQHASLELLKQLKAKGLVITLEMDCRNENAFHSLKPALLKLPDSIRVTGIEMIQSMDWLSKIKGMLGKQACKLDICPSNALSMATSIAVDAALSLADTLTLTFGGIGYKRGFGAFEEVLVALVLYCGLEQTVSLEHLPTIAYYFEAITGIQFDSKKPILGKSIFQVESGIHADGLGKDPETYEPFSPSWIGQRRELVIGKHSGSHSIMQKLKDMGIVISQGQAQLLLEAVRKKCAAINRSITSDELISLYRKTCIQRREHKHDQHQAN